MKTVVSIVFALIIGGTSLQDQGNVSKDAPGKPNPMQPGRYHKLLDALAGSWDVDTRFKYGPGPERAGKAACEAKWILGGRYLQQEYTSEIGGKPFITLQYTGYDNQKRRFFEIKMDNAETGVLHTEGTISQDEKTITNIGDRTDPMSGQTRRLRTVTTIIDKDHYTLEWFLMDDDGKEQKTVTMNHTRRKP